MAADTPVIWTPTGMVGVRLDEVLQLVASLYSGASTFRGRRWQVSLTNSFPASSTNVRYDTQARAADGRSQGEQWLEVPLALLNLAAGTAYYISCMDTNNADEASSWATSITFTTYADPFTGAVFVAGQ